MLYGLVASIAVCLAVMYFDFHPSTIFSLRPRQTCTLRIGLGPGRAGQVDFQTPWGTFHQDLDIEPGVSETVSSSFGGSVHMKVVLDPEEKGDGRVDVEARFWTGSQGPGNKGDGDAGGDQGGKPTSRWRQVRLLPDREQRLEWQWFS